MLRRNHPIRVQHGQRLGRSSAVLTKFVFTLSLALFSIALVQVSTAQSGPEGTGTMEGIVAGPNGPVSGALVAAVPLHASGGSNEERTRAAATTQSAADGAFRLKDLKAGDYALTATAPGLAAAFLGKLKVAANQSLSNLRLQLGAPETTFEGTLRGPDGQPLSQAEVRAERYSNEEGDIFYTHANQRGEYSITVPAAQYVIRGVAPGFAPAVETDPQAKGTERLDFTLDREGPAPAVVVDWIREHAMAIKTPEAGHGFDDLEPLKKVIGDARLVALGEATHGTREFFQFKHRMLEFLASEMGFNIFGMEATMPEGFDVNEYVLTGKGDPGKALAGLYFWTWNTEEVLHMIEWMRVYNADPRHARKLKFYGFDMQFTARAAKVTLAFLRKVNPQQAQKEEGALNTLYDPLLFLPSDPKSKRDAVAAAVKEILEDLDQQKENYIQRSSQEEWTQARQFARILQQSLEHTGTLGVRDRDMAENIGWILDHESPGSKMVIWAHNGHVDKKPGSGRMGSYLFTKLGTQMVVFGFAFNQGSFQAVEMPPESAKGRHSFKLGPAPVGSFDATLAAAGQTLAVLDLHALPPDGPVTGWFQRTHPHRSIGATFSDQVAPYYFYPLVPAKEFDAIIFVENTSSAHPIVAGYPTETLPAPANLDFELGNSAGTAEGWMMRPEAEQFDFHARLTTDRPHSGRQCLEIARDAKRHYGESAGSVAQTIDAAKFRGQRIRFRGWVRGELQGPLSSAHLVLSMRGRSSQAPKSYDAMTDRPPVTGQWQPYEITVDVPADAATISYSISMIGDGRIWLDDVSIESLAKPESSGATSFSK